MEAREHYQRARELSTETLGRINLWRRQALVLDKLGEFGGALRACDDVDQEIATVSAVPPTMVADVELARGLILGHSGAFTEAEAAAYRAIESVDADPESVIVARSGMLLGTVAWKQGRLVDAEQHIRASQTVAERIGDQNGMALCAINLALLLNDGSNHTEAEALGKRALIIYRQIGDEYSLALVSNNLGTFAYNRGAFQEAARRYRTGLGVRETMATAGVSLSAV